MVARRKLIRTGAALAAIGATITLGVAGSSPAQADPQALTNALNGFGSDSLQAIGNAYSGFEAGKSFDPLRAGPELTMLNSWDATPDNECIQTKPGSPSFHRPNGSSEGRYMLSQAIAGGNSYVSTTCGTKNVSSAIDFARSSSGDNDTTGPLLYAKMAKDALGFAYYWTGDGASPTTSLTLAQLQAAYQSPTVQEPNGVPLIACDIQAGSGTGKDWRTFMGIANGAQNPAGTLLCKTTGTQNGNGIVNGDLQENKSAPLVVKAEQLATALGEDVVVIVGYSAAAFIGNQNDVGETPSVSPSTVDMGIISDLGGGAAGQKPYLVSGPDYVANPAYYNGAFGRTVHFVVPTALIFGTLFSPGDAPNDPISAGNLALKQMFISERPGSADPNEAQFGWDDPATPAVETVARICHPDALATQVDFGFLVDTTICGTITVGNAVTATL